MRARPLSAALSAFSASCPAPGAIGPPLVEVSSSPVASCSVPVRRHRWSAIFSRMVMRGAEMTVPKACFSAPSAKIASPAASRSSARARRADARAGRRLSRAGRVRGTGRSHAPLRTHARRGDCTAATSTPGGSRCGRGQRPYPHPSGWTCPPPIGLGSPRRTNPASSAGQHVERGRLDARAHPHPGDDRQSVRRSSSDERDYLTFAAEAGFDVGIAVEPDHHPHQRTVRSDRRPPGARPIRIY